MNQPSDGTAVTLTPEERALTEARRELAEEMGTFFVDVEYQHLQPGELVQFTPEDWAGVDRLLEMRVRTAYQISDLERIANRRMDDIIAWLGLVTKGPRERLRYLDTVLTAVARHAQFPGKTKGMKLASGKVGRRPMPDTFTIEDMPKAVAFAKARGIPVKVVESVAIPDLKEYYKATKEFPDGCTGEFDRPDKPYVDTANLVPAEHATE